MVLERTITAKEVRPNPTRNPYAVSKPNATYAQAKTGVVSIRDGSPITAKKGIAEATITADDSALKIITPSTIHALRRSRLSSSAQAFFHVDKSIIPPQSQLSLQCQKIPNHTQTPDKSHTYTRAGCEPTCEATGCRSTTDRPSAQSQPKITFIHAKYSLEIIEDGTPRPTILTKRRRSHL